MIMVGAGTGLAPFRGFLQERAEQKANGATLAPSLLFFGCRTPADRLYADELDIFEKSADVLVYTAFSRQPSDGRKYAQHEMLAHQDEIWDLIDQGAQIFVCGNARTLAPGVRAALQQIYAAKTGGTADEAERAGWPGCGGSTATWRTSGEPTDRRPGVRQTSNSGPSRCWPTAFSMSSISASSFVGRNRGQLRSQLLDHRVLFGLEGKP